MPRGVRSISDNSLWLAALEGLEAQRKRLEEQIGQVQALLGRRDRRARPAASNSAPPARKRRELSAAARRRISAAQKRRWAEFRAKSPKKRSGKPGKPAPGETGTS